jgi:hypothetical protein
MVLEILNADITIISNLSLQEKSPHKVLSMLKTAKRMAEYSNNEEKKIQYSKEISGYEEDEALPEYRKELNLRKPILYYESMLSVFKIKKEKNEVGADDDRAAKYELENRLIKVGERIIRIKIFYMIYFDGLEQDILDFCGEIIKGLNKDSGKTAKREMPAGLIEVLRKAAEKFE